MQWFRICPQRFPLVSFYGTAKLSRLDQLGNFTLWMTHDCLTEAAPIWFSPNLGHSVPSSDLIAIHNAERMEPAKIQHTIS